MRLTTKWFVFQAGILLCSVLAAFPAAAADSSAEAADAGAGETVTGEGGNVVARIGEEETITEDELEKAVRKVLHAAMLRARRAGREVPRQVPPEMHKQVLEQLVGNRLIEMAAKEAGITVPEERVEEEMAKRKEALEKADLSFEDMLEREGLTSEQLKEELRTQLLVREFLDQRTADISIGEEEVKSRYNRLVEAERLEREQPTIDLARVMAVVPREADEEAWDEAKQTAEAFAKRLKEGESFQEVAEDVSEDAESRTRGGIFREVAREKMEPDVAEAVFDLETGAVTEPFRTEQGWNVVKVLERHEPGTAALEDVEHAIRAQILAEKKRETVKQIADRMKEKHPVQILWEPPEEEAPLFDGTEDVPLPDVDALLEQAS